MRKPSFGLESNKKPKKRFGLDPDTKEGRRKSIAQEERIAKKGRGGRIAASGALPGNPGDASLEFALAECKRTDSIGIYLSDKKLLKAEDEAASVGKTPLVSFDLDGRKNGKKKWILVPEDVFFAMLDELGSDFQRCI